MSHFLIHYYLTTYKIIILYKILVFVQKKVSKFHGNYLAQDLYHFF